MVICSGCPPTFKTLLILERLLDLALDITVHSGRRRCLVHWTIVRWHAGTDSSHQHPPGAGGCVSRCDYHSRAKFPLENALDFADGNAAMGVGAIVLGAADANSGRFRRGSVDWTDQLGRKPRRVYRPIPYRDGAYGKSQLHIRRCVSRGGIFLGGGINVHP